MKYNLYAMIVDLSKNVDISNEESNKKQFVTFLYDAKRKFQPIIKKCIIYFYFEVLMIINNIRIYQYLLLFYEVFMLFNKV